MQTAFRQNFSRNAGGLRLWNGEALWGHKSALRTETENHGVGGSIPPWAPLPEASRTNINRLEPENVPLAPTAYEMSAAAGVDPLRASYAAPSGASSAAPSSDIISET